MKWLETETGDLVNLAHVVRIFREGDRLMAQTSSLVITVAEGRSKESLQTLKIRIADFSATDDADTVFYTDINLVHLPRKHLPFMVAWVL